jgi:hypothetical protein
MNYDIFPEDLGYHINMRSMLAKHFYRLKIYGDNQTLAENPISPGRKRWS